MRDSVVHTTNDFFLNHYVKLKYHLSLRTKWVTALLMYSNPE